MSITQTPNWPRPPLCFLWVPSTLVDLLLDRLEVGDLGLCRSASTPNLRFIVGQRDLDVQPGRCPRPATRAVWGRAARAAPDPLRVRRASAARSSPRRPSTWHRWRSSPGASAVRQTGRVTGLPFTEKVSPEEVTLSLGTETMSPGTATSRGLVSLPTRPTTCPIRSSLCLVAFHTLESLHRAPENTRIRLSLPANGSEMVLNTSAARGASSSGCTRISSPWRSGP